jgi:tetratricopeptide (TPR) repeat protein
VKINFKKNETKINMKKIILFSFIALVGVAIVFFITTTLQQKVKNIQAAEEYFMKGDNAQENGFNELAIEYYQTAVMFNPEYIGAYNNMGAAYDNLQDYRKAIRCYQKAIEIDPSYADAYYNMGNAYANLQDYQEAIRCYQKAIANIEQPDPVISFNIGRNYYYWGTDSLVTPENRLAALYKADSTFTKITELAPTSFLGYFWRARTNSMIDPEASRGLAKPYYEKVIEILLNQADRYKRELIEGYKYLGYYYYMQADAIMKKNNNNPDKAKKEFLTAKSFFSKVLELNPDDAIAKDAQAWLRENGYGW